MSLIPWFDDLYRPRYSVSPWRDPDDSVLKNFWRHPLEEFKNLNTLLQDTEASISSDKDKFQANIDVAQFKPEEISVKVTGDNTITIEGKHEEKEDEHGYISRHFVRRYVLPENCDIKQVQSKLSSDGVLSITAPKVGEEKAVGYKEIPITSTGKPMKRIGQKKGTEKPKKK